MKKIEIVVIALMLAASGAQAQQAPATPPRAAVQVQPNAAAAGKAPKYDTKLPIEITSDTLEVLQHENKAIFKGNVVAVQGQMRLNSDVMVVHYQQKKDASAAQDPTQVKAAPPPPPPPQPAAQGPGSESGGMMGAITRIEVMGHVFMATPEESAKGDTGDYDVASKTLHLFGTNVTLTRDKNILRGTALEYNLATGRSLLTPGDTGRVRSVFVPNQDEKK